MTAPENTNKEHSNLKIDISKAAPASQKRTGAENNIDKETDNVKDEQRKPSKPLSIVVPETPAKKEQDVPITKTQEPIEPKSSTEKKNDSKSALKIDVTLAPKPEKPHNDKTDSEPEQQKEEDSKENIQEKPENEQVASDSANPDNNNTFTQPDEDKTDEIGSSVVSEKEPIPVLAQSGERSEDSSDNKKKNHTPLIIGIICFIIIAIIGVILSLGVFTDTIDIFPDSDDGIDSRYNINCETMTPEEKDEALKQLLKDEIVDEAPTYSEIESSYNGQLTFDDVFISLNSTTIDEFIASTDKWTTIADIENNILAPSEVEEYPFNCEGTETEIRLECTNMTDDEVDMGKCTISKFTAVNLDSDTAQKIILPGGVSATSSKEELIEVFGKPAVETPDIISFADNEYSSMLTLQYEDGQLTYVAITAFAIDLGEKWAAETSELIHYAADSDAYIKDDYEAAKADGGLETYIEKKKQEIREAKEKAEE